MHEADKYVGIVESQYYVTKCRTESDIKIFRPRAPINVFVLGRLCIREQSIAEHLPCNKLESVSGKTANSASNT